MNINNLTMTEIQENEFMDINGGLAVGALVGGIVGAGIGAYAGAVGAIIGIGTGSMSGSQARDVIKQSTMGGAGFGMGVGATPIFP